MKLYDELKWRGLIKDEAGEDLEEKLNAGGLTFYIGTDPTADSLHLGHLSSFLISKRLEKAGHHPILLVGGATGRIGDPRPTEERQMQPVEVIEHNFKCLKKQVEIMKQDERATYIALTSALASEYFNMIKLDKLIQNQEKLVELQKKITAMTEIKYNNGLCPLTEYLVEKQLYTQFQELLDIYINQRDTIGRQLVVLVGDRNLTDVKRSNYDNVSMPQIPESIAAECIQNRPDLLKTEEYIQKIGIDVKVARRDFLPKFTLYGQAGFNAYSLSNIFGAHTFKALAGVMPSLDLFTGGAKIAHLKYSKMEYEKAQQMYEKTILTSIQEVNDSLSSAIKSKKNYAMSNERNDLEKDKYQLMLRRKQIGALSDLDLMRAEENLILADKDEASNKINYIISTINIYKAVGGTDYMKYAENI